MWKAISTHIAWPAMVLIWALSHFVFDMHSSRFGWGLLPGAMWMLTLPISLLLCATFVFIEARRLKHRRSEGSGLRLVIWATSLAIFSVPTAGVARDLLGL